MIKLFNFLFKFYIDASIHVALAVYALFTVFVKTNGLVYDESIAYTLFYGTITSYNFVKFAPIAKLHYRNLTKNLQLIQVFSFFSFLGLIYYAFQLPFRTKVVFLVGMFLVIVYAIPVLQKKNLRSIGKLKIYWVAFCWTLSIVIAPTIHYKLPIISFQFLLEIFQLFILIIALIIPFDIRDLECDNGALRTIPQEFGIRKSKIFAVGLLFVYLLIDIYLWGKINYWLPSSIMVGLGGMIILKMPKRAIKYYCSFYIESLPTIKLVLLLLINRF